MTRLEEIKERLGKASPGPWNWGSWHRQYGSRDEFKGYKFIKLKDTDDGLELCRVEYEQIVSTYTTQIELSIIKSLSTGYGGETSIDISDKDADFIAHAPSDIAWLIEQVEKNEPLA